LHEFAVTITVRFGVRFRFVELTPMLASRFVTAMHTASTAAFTIVREVFDEVLGLYDRTCK